MTKYVTTGTYGRRYHTYHTDEDCWAVHGELIEATDNILDAYNMTECEHCAGTNDTNRKPDSKECPLCGTEVDKLPIHIKQNHE